MGRHSIQARVTATEILDVILHPEDFETWPPTAEEVHLTAIDAFENHADRLGVDYTVDFDRQALEG